MRPRSRGLTMSRSMPNVRFRALSLLPLMAATLWAWAFPATAFAQAVTIFSDDFETGYTTGTALPTTGNWSAITGSVTVEAPVSNTYLYLFKQTGNNASATTAAIDASGAGGQAVIVAFMLRYTSNNGNPVDNKTDGALAFNEFGGGGGTTDDIFIDYVGNAGLPFKRFNNVDVGRTYVAFKQVHLVIPSAALTSTMQIVFSQPSGTGGTSQWAIDDVQILINPEPGTWALFGLGAAGLAGVAARRRRRTQRAVAGHTAA